MYDSPPSRDRDEVEAWLAEREDVAVALCRAALARILTAALEAYATSLVASGDLQAIDGIPDAWLSFVTDELSDELGHTYLAGSMTAYLGVDEAGALSAAQAEQWAAVVNERAVSYLDTATNRLKGVGDGVWHSVRGAVQQAAQSGVGIDQLREDVMAVGNMAATRAEVIARTETIGAYVNGDMGGMEALGDKGPVEKVWRATGDLRTRPTHVEADGQCVPFSTDFTVGSSRMSHPHAAGAPAAEVVQCRCYVEFLFAGDARPDGSTVDAPEPVAAPAVIETATEKPAPRTARYARIDEAAERYDVTRAEVLAHWDSVRDVTVQIRAEAARSATQSLRFLDSFDGVKLRRPGRAAAGEYDALKGLDPTERSRLSAWWTDSPTAAPDVVLQRAQAAGIVSDQMSVGDFMDEWLHHTRVVDAATSLRSGRLPTTARFGGVNLDDVLPEMASAGIDATKIVGASVQDAAGYLAAHTKDETVEYAWRILNPGGATIDPPWRMSFQSWDAEVRDLEYLINSTTGATAADVARYHDLIPSALDVGQDYEDLYAAIVETARAARIELPDHVGIPWA